MIRRRFVRSRTLQAGPKSLAVEWTGGGLEGNGLEIASCTIITTEANRMMQPLHDRMPVIVADADQARWLDASTDAGDLLRPAPDDLLKAYPVSTRVNSPANEGDEFGRGS